MAGVGIGIGLGSGGVATLTEAAIARTLAAKGLTDAAARSAVGGASSLAAGLRSIGLMRSVATPTPTPTPAPNPGGVALPAGTVARWDAGSLAGRANGAPVTSWTDSVAGIVAAQTSDSGAAHSFVADSGGGLPAVRLSGAAVLATSGAHAAAAALSGDERAIMVVARNPLGTGPGQANPCVVAFGSSASTLLQLSPTQTGRYGRMFDCGDAGIRVVGCSGSASLSYGIDCINGTAIQSDDQGGNRGEQLSIGGWRNAGTQCCGRADVLAVLVFDRAITAADFKRVRRHFAERAGEAYPAGPTVSCLGDSLTYGYPGAVTRGYPFQMAAGLGLPWGRWDSMGVPGNTWVNVRVRQAAMLGAASGVTGVRSVVCAFEFANMRGDGAQAVAGAASAAMTAIRAADPLVDIAFGTSTDDGSSAGRATQPLRAAYNAWWDDPANRAGIAAYVPLHLDPDIGVAGAAPASGGNGFYTADGLHLTEAGYAKIDAGPNGFRMAVKTLLGL